MKSIEHLRATYRSLIVSKHLKGISDGEIAAHFHLMPVGYFVNKPEAVIIQHILMIRALRNATEGADPTTSLLPIIEWKDLTDEGVTEVTIVTPDRSGLFYKLAGAFSMADLNILGAKAISRSDHIAIDTFYVSEAAGGIVRSEKTKDAFYRLIDEVLVLNTDLVDLIKAKCAEAAIAQPTPSANPSIIVEPRLNSVEIYQEISRQRTKVEVNAPDKLGMLFFLTKTISDHGYDITFASITTEQGNVSDTFHITAAEDKPNPNRLHDLRTALTQVIAPADKDAACVAGAV